MEKDAQGALLYELLTIFSSCSLGDYLAFHAKNGAFLASVNLDHKKCAETMRLLTLANLAAKENVISYDSIVSELMVRPLPFPLPPPLPGD